jgi:hypothetical protein
MQNELFARILLWSAVFPCLSATAVAANSALFIVCLSGCDLMSLCVMEFVLGFTTLAPRMRLPLAWEPSV